MLRRNTWNRLTLWTYAMLRNPQAPDRAVDTVVGFLFGFAPNTESTLIVADPEKRV